MGSYRSYSNPFAAPGALAGDVTRAVFFDWVVGFGWEGGGVGEEEDRNVFSVCFVCLLDGWMGGVSDVCVRITRRGVVWEG